MLDYLLLDHNLLHDFFSDLFPASNVTGMIDLAFVDRADLKRYIGPPSAEAAYGILRGSALELMKSFSCN